MKPKYLIIMLYILIFISTSTLFSADKEQKNYPQEPYNDMIISVQYKDKVTEYPINFKPKVINLMKDAYFPEFWDLPTKKTPLAMPNFGKEEKMGLMLEVYLKYNKEDGVLSLIGKYDYKVNFGGDSKNIYISDPNLKTYKNIRNCEIKEFKSTFYLIKFELNKKYEIVLTDDDKHKQSVYLTISEKKKK